MPAKIDDALKEMLNEFCQCIGIPAQILNKKQAARFGRKQRLLKAIQRVLEVLHAY